MIEIYLLEQLVALAEHGTLSKAAEKLHISQPALTRSMKKLESNLGITLFERNNKKIRLNETGKLASVLAQSQIEQNQEMVSRLIAFDRNLHSIHIGASAPKPMSDLMPLLQSHFGDMTISSKLIYGEKLLNGLKNNTYQLAIFCEVINDNDIICQHFTSENLYVSLPKNHRLARNESVTFSELVGEKFLLYQHIGFWKSVCVEYMKGTSFIVQPDRDSFIELVCNTDYPAFSSDAILKSDDVPENRVYIPIDEEKARYTYYVACHINQRQKYASFMSDVRNIAIR